MTDDCEEFLEFSERYGPEVAAAILESICCHETIRAADYEVISIHAESRDREGANHRLTGTVKVRSRHFGFMVDSGNWAGTEIIDWCRCSGVPLRPVPAQGPWLFADIAAVSTRMKLDGFEPLLSKKASSLMAPVRNGCVE